MGQTWVRSLGWEDPLEKGKATHSSILAWSIHGVSKSRTRLSDFRFHSLLYSCHLFFIMSASRSILCLSFIVPSLREIFPWYFQFSWRDLYSFHFYCFPLFLCIVHLGRLSSISLLFFDLNRIPSVQFSSVQSLSRVWRFATPWIAARQASLSITNSQSSLKLTSIESVMPSSHLILCCLPPIPPSIRVFSNESTLRMRWPKYWRFSFSIIPSKEHPGLLSFRMDYLDLLAVQGTLKSLLQHLSSKASIVRCSAFFRVQLSHPYMTTGKTISLTRWTFAGKVMSLLLNMPFRLVITFLGRSKRLLISWLQSPSAVILEPQKIKSDTVSIVSPSISHEVMGPDAMLLVFWMLSCKPTFSLSTFTFIKRLFSSSSLSAIRVVSSAYLGLLGFLLAILIPACPFPAQHFSWCTLNIS